MDKERNLEIENILQYNTIDKKNAKILNHFYFKQTGEKVLNTCLCSGEERVIVKETVREYYKNNIHNF